MKRSICCILLVLVSRIFGTHIRIDAENLNLCDALNSIIQLNVLTPPLNIQLRDPNFDHCINTSNATVLINLVTNETRLISQSSVVVVETKAADVLKNVSNLMNHNSNHLIVIGNYSSGDLDELVHQFWKNLLINASFLVNINATIAIQTFIPYNEGIIELEHFFSKSTENLILSNKTSLENVRKREREWEVEKERDTCFFAQKMILHHQLQK